MLGRPPPQVAHIQDPLGTIVGDLPIWPFASEVQQFRDRIIRIGSHQQRIRGAPVKNRRRRFDSRPIHLLPNPLNPAPRLALVCLGLSEISGIVTQRGRRGVIRRQHAKLTSISIPASNTVTGNPIMVYRQRVLDHQRRPSRRHRAAVEGIHLNAGMEAV